MQNISHKIVKEVLWLALAVILTIISAFLLFGQSFVKGVADIHLGDTYFVITSWYLLVPVFLIFTLIIYFIKAVSNKFTSKFANIVLLITVVLLIVSLNVLLKMFSQVTSGG